MVGVRLSVHLYKIVCRVPLAAVIRFQSEGGFWIADATER